MRNIKKYIFSFNLSLVVFLVFSCSNLELLEKNNKHFTAKLFSDNLIALHPDTLAYKNDAKSYKWNYEQGLVLEAIYRLWIDTKNQKYFDYTKKNIDYYVQDNGAIKTYEMKNFNLDNIAPGRMLLHLYELTKQNKYKIAADTLIKQLKMQPRTSDGGFWHKKIYPNQMWLDGLYMAEPFYAEYSVMFKETSNFDDIAKQFLLIRAHSYNKKTGLYYHGWDETKQQRWANPISGTSNSFWGRSLGWFIMALVDVIDYFPQNHKDRKELLMMFQQLSSDLLQYRDDDTKLWFQIVDKKNSEGNYIETSASSMFIYALAKGFNKGYLDEKFRRIANESFDLLVKNYIKKDDLGRYVLTNVCSVGGLGGNPYRDGSFEYYISEPKRDNDFKGYGALILAANEIAKCTLN